MIAGFIRRVPVILSRPKEGEGSQRKHDAIMSVESHETAPC